jgi:hypothetical protein
MKSFSSQLYRFSAVILYFSMAVYNYAKTLVFNRILATKSEIQNYQSIKILEYRWILRFDTLAVDVAKIETCKLIFISPYKIIYLVFIN